MISTVEPPPESRQFEERNQHDNDSCFHDSSADASVTCICFMNGYYGIVATAK